MEYVWCGVRQTHAEHGDCPGAPESGVMMTVEQLLGYLRGASADAALSRLEVLMESAEHGFRCFIQNHDGIIKDLKNWRMQSLSRPGIYGKVCDVVDEPPAKPPRSTATNNPVDKAK